MFIYHGRIESGKNITKTKHIQDYQRDRLVKRDLGTFFVASGLLVGGWTNPSEKY